MVKTFDEFVLEQETLEEGKLKNIVLATSLAANLLFGANYLKNHPEEKDKIEYTQEQEIERINFAENYFPSDEIIDFIKNTEGWHQGWKKDGKGILTTGWGFRYTDELKKKYPKGMTKEQANKYFLEVALPERVRLFKESVPNINEYTQRQLDALFDLYYNIGHRTFKFESPNLQKALMSVDYASIVKNMDHDYNNKRLPGIKIRRDFERDLFMQDVDKDLS